ncbi:MAG: peptidyl-prolyl cis-trans isomerase [Bacteroidia bacterium]|nr:peptidyl-prolyl cis-trans isomerase [Bacteroidia bacterium]MDW8235238.1 peptidylprolyl isomerase [Bacteroidia bacterium]
MRILLAGGIWALLWAQDWSKRQAELARLGKSISVTQAEFEYAYAKSHGGWQQATQDNPEEYRKYLNAYLNFRRKVADALERRMDTSRAFREEYEGYLRQLARPYLLEKEVLDTLMRNIYQRMKEEIRASHILISVRERDSASALKLIQQLRDSALKGADFGELAKAFSNDPSAAQNKGDLGYFSAFDMVAPFEDAAYATPVGSISQPVLTQYGYHIIYVKERVPHAGRRKVAHILVRWGPTYAAKDSIEAEKRIQDVYQRLQGGAKWEEIARDFSDDPMSASRGGELGWMRLLPEMEKVKRELSAGEISRPFRTRFGWHILKVLEVRPVGSYEEMRSELKSRLVRDERYRLAEQAFFDKRLLQRKYQENPTTRKNLYTALDTLYPDINRALSVLPKNLLEATLFMVEKKKYSVKEFLTYWNVQRGLQPAGKLSETIFQQALRAFAHEKLLDLEMAELPQRYPDFELLRREYYYGVLFFNISEKEVWRKAVEDTTGLKRFYEERKSDFPANERLEVIELVGRDSLSLAELPARLPQPTLLLLDSINLATQSGWRIVPTFVERGKGGEVYADFFNNGVSSGWTAVKGTGREWKIAYILRRLPAGYKTYEEVRVELIQRYQEELEKRWLERLGQKFPAKVDEKVFARLFK